MKKNNQSPNHISRRKFILNSSLGLGAMSLGSLLSSNQVSAMAKGKKLGIALVGLGNYASGQLAPALLETQHCYLSAIVTGTKSKAKQWQEKYSIPDKNVYNYDNFDDIANNDDIDIVYVVLPNSMHAEYSIRAAKAGKHVISEKPMAVSVGECQNVIDTCKKEKVKLGIGYRLHYDSFNLEMMRLGQKKVYGDIQDISANFSFKMKNLTQWRAKKEYAGGGPLMDLGVYCIQGILYTLGELPTSVSARETTIDKSAWKTVEGSLEWTMKFKSGITAKCTSSYEKPYNDGLIVKAKDADFGLRPAYIYDNLGGYVTGKNSNKGTNKKLSFATVNQQALQMDAFASNVLNDTEILVPGEMGMRDMFIIEKIYQSMSQGGKEVSLSGIPNVLRKI